MFRETDNLESLYLGMLKSGEMGHQSWKCLQVCVLINVLTISIPILSPGHRLGWGIKTQRSVSKSLFSSSISVSLLQWSIKALLCEEIGAK